MAAGLESREGRHRSSLHELPQGTDSLRIVHQFVQINSERFFSPPQQSSSPRNYEGEETDDQRPPKRIRTIQSKSPERHRGQLAKRGKRKKGRHGTQRRAGTEAASDEEQEEDQEDYAEEPPEDYQDFSKTKMNQLTEANKLAKNKLAVCEIKLPL